VATETYSLHLIEDEDTPGTWDVSMDGRHVGQVYESDTWRIRCADKSTQLRAPDRLYPNKVTAAWALAATAAH